MRICAGVVFWASSRMTTASLRVRPRMKARGAIWMTRLQIGIYFLFHVARQETEFFASFDGWAREDNLLDRLLL